MFPSKLSPTRLAIMSLCALSVAACTPAFESTSQKCSAISPVSLAIEQTSDNTEFLVNANRPTNNYELYLEDTLNSFANIQSKAEDGSLSDLSEDEAATVQFVFDKADEYMGYSIVDGVVAFANNPLDFFESLIAATDEEEVVETFIDAKRNLATAVADDDSVCSYRNSQITLRVEDPDSIADDNAIKKLNTQLNLSYNPYDEGDEKDVDQIVLITEKDQPELERNDEEEIEASLVRFYSGINRISASDYVSEGVSPSEVRQFTISDNQTSETYFFDDDFDTLNLGQIVSSYFNAPCLDDEGEQTTCTDPESIWVPQHPACEGGVDDDGDERPDETNQIRVNGFTIVPGNDALTDIQRFRVEVDYPENEIRIYVSKYAEAILEAGADPDSTDPEDIIFNPTDCEKQAVLDDLLNEFTEEEQKADDFEGVRLTLVPDPNYDIIYVVDDDGEPVLDIDGEQETEEPTPIFTFEGTAIPDRQTVN